MSKAPVGLRRQPLQKRSKERVARVLGAAAEILAEVGYAGLTTNAVAERAGVPVGTLYQFFERKEDIVAALVRDFAERLDTFADSALSAELLQKDVPRFVARLVDGIGELQAQSSAFICLYAGSQSHHEFDALAARLRETLTGRLDATFAKAFPEFAAAERRRLLNVWQEVTRAMIANLDKSKRGERAALVEELKLILSSYLVVKLQSLQQARA
jgi:AcrR family transcriptional regulator